MPAVRPAAAADLPALTALYNHYVVHTPITFDVEPFEPEQRRAWLDSHAGGRYRLLVAVDGNAIAGYASTSRWRPKAAYDTTVESTVYVRHDLVGRGIGRLLYDALFAAMADQDVLTIVAGVALPNPASIAFHERCGFRQVGVFREVGRKFDRFWDVAWLQRPCHPAHR
ncbi:MAG TPA: GNAT family N-acetyltransferase [Vicinamibacterales bacterium]|jgi:phosphinothricin acetyltransferase